MHIIDITEFGHLITACRALFTTSFTNIMVEFIQRQVNMVARVLVDVTLLVSCTTYFNIPHCIENIIINEMLQVTFFKIK